VSNLSLSFILPYRLFGGFVRALYGMAGSDSLICVQIAKSMPLPFLEDAVRNLLCVCMDCEVDPFSFFNGFRLENLIGIGDDDLVCDREVDGLSVLMGMFIRDGIGRGISFSLVRILFRM